MLYFNSTNGLNNLFIHTFVELKFNFEKRLIIFRLDSGLQVFARLQVFSRPTGKAMVDRSVISS